MYAVSTTWATAQESFLAPEGLIEISCYIPELRNTLVYTKKDLLSFTHQQTGDLVSGELPKNHIEFSLDNSDGRWNPSNPKGMERYLSERLRITLRYGFIINGAEEWIPGGVFYLSGWNTSANSLEARFTARDLLEYMIDKPFTGEVTGTLYDIAQRAINAAEIPADAIPQAMVLGSGSLGSSILGGITNIVSLSDELKNYSVGDIEYKGNETIAVILQKCANAAGCVMYQGRDGVFRIYKNTYAGTGYVMPKRWAYSYPEMEFARPLKNVSVTYFGNENVTWHYGGTGETQTLNNEFIFTKDQAVAVAKWVCDSLRTRKKITGEIRGDPKFDLFDVVDAEDRYGIVSGVVLTDIKCVFNGAFRISYTGYIRGGGVSGNVYSGEVFSGEVK
jgi:hypothetical protein